MNESLRKAIREIQRPYETALEAVESIANNHIFNWQDTLLEDARKATTLGAIDINEILGTFRSTQAIDQINNNSMSNMIGALHAEFDRSALLTGTLAKYNSNFLNLTATLAEKHAEIIESSRSDLLKLASGQSALTDAMEQINGSTFANIFKELEVSQYAELLQPDFLESLRKEDDYVDDNLIFTSVKTEIIENLSSGIDFKYWRKKALKIFKTIIYVLATIVTLAESYKLYNELFDSSQSIKTENQVNTFVQNASKKFDIDDLVEYRITKRRLKLRPEPNIKLEEIEILPIGKVLFIVDDSRRYWMKVKLTFEGETLEGWVSKKFTKKFE